MKKDDKLFVSLVEEMKITVEEAEIELFDKALSHLEDDGDQRYLSDAMKLFDKLETVKSLLARGTACANEIRLLIAEFDTP